MFIILRFNISSNRTKLDMNFIKNLSNSDLVYSSIKIITIIYYQSNVTTLCNNRRSFLHLLTSSNMKNVFICFILVFWCLIDNT